MKNKMKNRCSPLRVQTEFGFHNFLYFEFVVLSWIFLAVAFKMLCRT
jgi:hypothetical protein